MRHVPLPSSPKRALAILLIAVLAVGSLVLSRPAGANATLAVYDDELNADWANYSWNADVDFASFAQVHGGQTALGASIDAWGAIYLSTNDSVQAAGGAKLSPDSVLEFAIYADEADTVLFLQAVGLDGSAGAATEVLATPGQWQTVSIPMTDLTDADAIAGLWWQNASNGSRSIALDDITITGAADEPADDPADPTDPTDPVDPTDPTDPSDPGESASDEIGVFDIVVFDDELQSGFSDGYSWLATVRNVNGQSFEGERSLSANIDSFGALYLGSETDVTLPDNAVLHFALRGTRNDTTLWVQLVDSAGNGLDLVEVSPPRGQWESYAIPVAALGDPSTIGGLWFQNAGSETRRVFVDEVVITAGTPGEPEPTPEPTPDPGDPTPEPTPDPGDPGDIGEFDQIIYDDVWGPNVLDYSWGTSVFPGSFDQVHSGENSLHAEFDVWGGLYAASPTTWALPDNAVLEFSVYPVTFGSLLGVEMADAAGQPLGRVEITPETGTWTRYEIPTADLGGDGEIGGFWFQSLAGDYQKMYFDDVLITGTGPGEPSDPGDGNGPALSISLGDEAVVRTTTDPNTGTTLTTEVNFPHDISEGVYGLNFAAPTLVDDAAGLDIPFHRWGGNATARYNHETGSGVIGFDYFFMTDPGTQGSDHTWENTNQANGMESLLTVPISGWVSKGTEPSCGYPLPEWGPMDQSQPHWLDGDLLCGNGERNGEVIPGDPTNTSMAIDPSFVQNWVEEMVSTHGPAAAGGVENYALDNEPNLWAHTHSDMRSAPIPRDELFERSVDYATAIKQGDPTAGVYGPVLWGGFSIFQTSDELDQGLFPSSVPNFIDDYLATMRQAGDEAGVRLLDALSVNFYDDRSFVDATPEYRLQSTRSLWDPTWAPQDWWLVRDFLGGDGVAMIPRLQAQIAQSYPGTELAITEYNFGSLDTMDGALAQADALGVFGREGVDTATLWDPFSPELNFDEPGFVNKPAYWAYRMYRNADGNGERFGDRALFAETGDYDAVSIYAAERTSDGAITIMLVNKSQQAQQSQLNVDGVTGTAAMYEYSETDLSAIRQLDPIDVAGDTTITLAPWSITMLVID